MNGSHAWAASSMLVARLFMERQNEVVLTGLNDCQRGANLSILFEAGRSRTQRLTIENRGDAVLKRCNSSLTGPLSLAPQPRLI